MTTKGGKKQHYTLCSIDEVSNYIGLSSRTIKERWLKNPKKAKQYNGIQIISFLERENIDEETLYGLVKLYNGIINNKKNINKIFNKILEKI